MSVEPVWAADGLESFRLFAEVTERSFEEVAGWVRQATERIRTVWQEKASELPYLPAERTRLEAHMARVPLLFGGRTA